MRGKIWDAGQDLGCKTGFGIGTRFGMRGNFETRFGSYAVTGPPLTIHTRAHFLPWLKKYNTIIDQWPMQLKLQSRSGGLRMSFVLF